MSLIARLLVTVLLVLAATACSGDYRGIADLPLPGGPDLGDHPMRVTITSADVLSLAERSTVKVDDVTVGEVESIDRVGWQAEVVVRIRGDLRLPANAEAAVRQTGLLGEKYVELGPPTAAPPRGRLQDGAHIGLSSSARSFEVEEVLSSLSLLLNGGGLEDVKTIAVELHQAVEGREDRFRSLLRELDDVTGTLAASRGAIDRALHGLDQLSRTLARGKATVAKALDRLGPAVKILADQRAAFVRMLGATSRLSRVGVETVRGVRADLVANLRALEPVLANLARAGDDVPRSLRFLLSYPFPDSAMQAVRGDYVNFDATYVLTLRDLLGGLRPPGAGTGPSTRSDESLGPRR